MKSNDEGQTEGPSPPNYEKKSDKKELSFYDALLKFLSDPLYRVLAFIFLISSVSVASTWYIVEKTRIEAYKEEVRRLEKLLDQRSHKDPSIVQSRNKNNKTGSSSQIIDKIKNCMEEGNRIKNLDIQEDKTYDDFINWRESAITLLLSLGGDIRNKYSAQFQEQTSLSMTDYQKIPTKINIGLSILRKAQTLVQHGN